ncbi:MAG: GAF and ANTAR domain-containing protein [Actinomycetota bacterium]|nr:GAF and ANTAR domain-containing protein [Actinomycetota bacterium]
MAQTEHRDIGEHLAALHGALSEETLEAALDRVAAISLRTLPGCDGAGVSLVEREKVTTASATDSNVEAVDSDQYSTGEGPCLEAIRRGIPFIVESMADDRRWPRFGPRAAEKGILSSLSLPLRVHDRTLGALNLYSRSRRRFTAEDERTATLFAAQAAVALANAHAFDRVRAVASQLEEGLKSSRVIGLAMGILVEREHCTENEAFDMLRAISQNTNIKLRDVAEQLLQATSRRH